jgi:hypothetical protein
MGKVSVEGFPTRNEIIELLDKFLDSKGQDRSYSLNNADNVIEITLKDYVYIT